MFRSGGGPVNEKQNKQNAPQQPRSGGRRNACSCISIRSHLFCIEPDAPLFVSLLINACGVWECEKRLHLKGQRVDEDKISNSHHIPVVSL